MFSVRMVNLLTILTAFNEKFSIDKNKFICARSQFLYWPIMSNYQPFSIENKQMHI